MTRKLHFACVLVMWGAVATVSQAESITTGALAREMVDMHRLARFPTPAFKTVQFSSYDHRSAVFGGPDWFANADGFGQEPLPNFEQVLREPDDEGVGEYLICDVQGPGAIVRTWTAAIAGTIRLYLDGAAEPIFDGSAHDFLRTPYKPWAEAAGLEEALLNGTFYQQNAAYCPIPFAKRCRMVWIGKIPESHFYQIQIRIYEPGTAVATFQPNDLKRYGQDLRDVARVLSAPGENWVCKSKETPLPIVARVAAGETQTVLELEGPRALERLTLRARAERIDGALRQTILHIYCDGHSWGQVQSPLGDFFGVAPGINPYDSVPFTVAPEGTMTCRYVMPFAKSLKIVLENRGDQVVTVTGSALPVDYEWDAAKSMHFRARWRIDHGLIANPRAVQDLPFLVANGQGVYVGTAVMLLNPTPVPTPYGGWWGEGDEKVFVDDDVRPSTFGTGSEDYFNYAWSIPDIFIYPYCGQPRNDGPGNRGFVTNNRWHVLDCLPFRQRIAFYMELCSHERTPGFSYGRIAYHYGRPGLYDDHVPITDEDLRHLELPPNWEPAARMGARNSVFYQTEELARPGAEVVFEDGRLWARERLFVWRPAQKGAQLVLDLPIGEDGKYVLYLGLAETPTSGKISVQLDGEAIGYGGEAGMVDLYRPQRILHRHHGSDEVELTKGMHVLTVQYEGAAGAGAGQTVGLDYVAVQKR